MPRASTGYGGSELKGYRLHPRIFCSNVRKSIDRTERGTQEYRETNKKDRAMRLKHIEVTVNDRHFVADTQGSADPFDRRGKPRDIGLL